jgi:hypothetical protein
VALAGYMRSSPTHERPPMGVVPEGYSSTTWATASDQLVGGISMMHAPATYCKIGYRMSAAPANPQARRSKAKCAASPAAKSLRHGEAAESF